MPTVDVVDLNNQKVGEVELADAVFGAEVNEALLYEAVRHYQAGQRAGTHKTKTRHEVAGSGKKLWKQKGTGRARMGSVRSPDLAAWRHGPRAGAARLQLQAAAQDAAGRAALGAFRQAAGRRVEGGAGVQLADHKTKNAMNALAKLEAGRKVLVVDNGENRNLALGRAQYPGRDADAHARSEALPSAGPPERAAFARRRRGSYRRRSQNDHLRSDSRARW